MAWVAGSPATLNCSFEVGQAEFGDGEDVGFEAAANELAGNPDACEVGSGTDGE
jgi:hypothetical protein